MTRRSGGRHWWRLHRSTQRWRRLATSLLASASQQPQIHPTV
jgi:hypothetical protein